MNCSYSEMSADVVIDACTQFLEARTARIKAFREAKIQKRMAKKWWRPWNISYESAKKSFQGDIWSSYHMIAFEGSYWVTRAKEVKALAQTAKENNSTIFIDSEIASVLQPYF